MNDQFPKPNLEDADFARQLETLSEQTAPDPHFSDELERRLKSAHKPRTLWWTPKSHSILPSVGWVALVVVAGLALIWTIQNLVPKAQPGSDPTGGFVCPVTQPNGETPPQEQPSVYHFGNGEIWTDLWPNGKVYMTPENREPDGSYSMKWIWWRNTTGPLDIEGRRLDATSESMGVFYTDGYDDAGVYVVALSFPSPGCWEVTARAGNASLTFITEVFFDKATPVPDMTTVTSTPAPDATGYDWRASKLFLTVPLPQLSGDELLKKLYALKQEQSPTLETVQALAAQFGVQGEVYKTPNSLPGDTGYLVTDGRQRLYVQSTVNFSYYADYPSYTMAGGSGDLTDEQAASAIEAFMRSHGLTFAHRIENPHVIPGMYYILPLLPDGSRLQYDYNMPARIEATLDRNGQVVLLASYRADYETLDGTYGIITAEEAFQQVLNSSDMIQNGVLESMRSASGMFGAGFWNHSYPDNETVTIYGQPQTYPSGSEGGAPFIGIGQFAAVGNVAGLENVDYTLFVEATGQFVTENGIRKFRVDSWKRPTATEAYLSGSLRDEGGQTILTAEDGSGEYILESVPADVPRNTAPGDGFLSIHGFTANGKFVWDYIQYLPGAAMGGGGGGGSGQGFYQLNLGGTPAPFPTPTLVTAFTTPDLAVNSSDKAVYSVQEGDTCGSIAAVYNIPVAELIERNNLSDQCIITIGQTLLIPNGTGNVPTRVEKLRGILSVTIYEQTDGSSRTVYGFLNMAMSEAPGTFYYYLLEGDGLQDLQQYNGRPIDVWGTVVPPGGSGVATIQLDRFEIPFPDLRYQILKGTQTSAEIGGQTVLLFTDEKGQDYVELGLYCSGPFGLDSMVGQPGDSILVEALQVPGLTFGDYPAICVYSSVMAIDPKTNQPMELTITADQPSILPEPPTVQPGSIPTATIESVELVYYVPNPTYGTRDPENVPYIQPAWRFQGHYSDGSVFEILVQALRREYLLPEIVPNQPPG